MTRALPSLYDLLVFHRQAGRPRKAPRVSVELRLDEPVFLALDSLMADCARRRPAGWQSPHDLVNLALGELLDRDRNRKCAKPSLATDWKPLIQGMDIRRVDGLKLGGK